MSLEQSEAVVLRIYPWSEASCIASVYTREHGKLSLLAKGARRPKSPFEAALDLLSICRVVFLCKSSEALDILTEARLERRFRAGSRDLLRLHCGYYVAELLDRLTEKGDPQPEIYDLAATTLGALEQEQLDPRAVILRFELQMLRLVGHLPSFRRCVHCGRDALGSGPDDDGIANGLECSPGAIAGNQREWLLFSAISGGIICSQCQLGARQTLRVHRQAQATLDWFSQPNWKAIPVEHFTCEHRAAIRKILVRYLTTLLDRQLHLHAYLEELGR